MNPIPNPVQSVLDLFCAELADVRFADVDASTLARIAADVDAAAQGVAFQQAALDSAQKALREQQTVLLEYVQRALAYARVFAEKDEALSARIEAIELPRVARRVKGGDDAPILSPALRTKSRKRRRSLESSAGELLLGRGSESNPTSSALLTRMSQGMPATSGVGSRSARSPTAVCTNGLFGGPEETVDG
jgi:hypothetical protein